MKKPLNKFIRLSGIGLQLGLTIYICAYLGGLLDNYFETNSNTWKLILILAGFVLSMYSLIRRLKNIQDD